MHVRLSALQVLVLYAQHTVVLTPGRAVWLQLTGRTADKPGMACDRHQACTTSLNGYMSQFILRNMRSGMCCKSCICMAQADGGGVVPNRMLGLIPHYRTLCCRIYTLAELDLQGCFKMVCHLRLCWTFFPSPSHESHCSSIGAGQDFGLLSATRALLHLIGMFFETGFYLSCFALLLVGKTAHADVDGHGCKSEGNRALPGWGCASASSLAIWCCICVSYTLV